MNSAISISKILIASTLTSALFLVGCGSDNNNDTTNEVSQRLIVKTENYAPDQTSASTSLSHKVTYKMPAIEGGQTTATAVVMIPKGNAPIGGWPIVVWAHGTTGVADQCAPSNLKSVTGEFNLGGALPLVSQLVNQGYAVISPDYEGLGSVGIHPFLNAKSESESIISALKAAKQQYNAQLSSNWVIVGHSQGGHAAIAAAERANDAGLNFKGVVAYAPASNLDAILLGGYSRVISQLGQPAGVPTAKAILPGLQSFSALVSAGIKQYQPAFNYTNAFTSKQSADIAATAETECYPQVVSNFTTDINAFYNDSQNSKSLYPGLNVNFDKVPAIATFLVDAAIGKQPISQPILVLQGVLDSTVPQGATQLLEQQVRASNQTNANIIFKYEADKDHGSIVGDALNPNGQLALFLKTNLTAK